MMRKYAMAAAAVMMMVVGTSASAQLAVKGAGAKKVTLNDKVGNNQFTWTSDAPLEKIKGTADAVSGSFTIDPTNVAATRGTITVQVKSMKTGNATRDEHMAGAQWLNAAEYPTITFTIASVTGVKVSGNKAKATAHGTFTMHGVSKKLAVPFELTYLDESPATQKRAPGDLVMITADFTIALKDYKVVGAQGVVGSKVGETIAISAKLYGSTK